MVQSTSPASPKPSTPPSRPGGPSPTTRRSPWDTADLRELLAGALDQAQMRARDNKGLSPVEFGAMKSAVLADALLPLLSLLEPPQPAEQSKIDVALDLLEKIAANQVRLDERLAAIESRLAKPSGPSPTPSRPTGKPGSAH